MFCSHLAERVASLCCLYSRSPPVKGSLLAAECFLQAEFQVHCSLFVITVVLIPSQITCWGGGSGSAERLTLSRRCVFADWFLPVSSEEAEFADWFLHVSPEKPEWMQTMGVEAGWAARQKEGVVEGVIKLQTADTSGEAAGTPPGGVQGADPINQCESQPTQTFLRSLRARLSSSRDPNEPVLA